MTLITRLRQLTLAVTFGAVLATSLSAPVAAQSVPYSAYTPFGIWEVPRADLPTVARHHKLIVKAFEPTMDIVGYFNDAHRLGIKVVPFFMNTVDIKTGTVYPSRVAWWVNKVKTHPALYGYLSVREPSWFGITLTEMRSLYKAYKSADPYHRVIALLGDTPHFGTSRNPWGPGVANMLWVDWYPVTCTSGYYNGAITNFPKVRRYVDTYTPGTPIWLTAQTHENRVGNKCTPTAAQMDRQVYEGFRYLKAQGILWFVWNGPKYERDLKRNAFLQSHVAGIQQRVRNRTF